MGFGDNKNFAVEFAFRSKLNYYQLLKLEMQASEEDCTGIDRVINEIITQMEEREFHTLAPHNLCSGTQLMNSVLGLLVFPEQQLFGRLSTELGGLRRDLPELYGCIHNPDNQYINTYHYYSEKYHDYSPEKETIKNVLIHMRNSLSHKRIMFYPSRNDINTDQITHLIFEDEKVEIINEETSYKSLDYLQKKELLILNKDGKPCIRQQFRLQIPKSNFEPILMEIADYFTSIG